MAGFSVAAALKEVRDFWAYPTAQAPSSAVARGKMPLRQAS